MAYLRGLFLEVLRSDDNLVPYMRRDGFFPEPVVKIAMEHVIGEKLSPEVFSQVVDGFARAVERREEGGEKLVRATFGHSGKILAALNWGRYTPYVVRFPVFCLTHFTRNGLGAVNYNRTFNLLNTPERCDNKGVKGYINVQKAMATGVEFWSQVGDRYGNKIFCFDPNLADHIYHFEYVPDYTDPERMKRSQSNYIETVKAVCGMDEEGAIRHLQKLVVIEEDENEGIEDMVKTLRI
jgi:hypothetical protein